MGAMAASSAHEPTWLYGGLATWSLGLCIETMADTQLIQFLKDPSNRGRVLQAGLWKYSRHPNYFGDSLVWWGFFGMSVGLGAPIWTVIGPFLMTILLLKVSGVALMEKTISSRRPEYMEYVRRTNAFIPGIPKTRTRPD